MAREISLASATGRDLYALIRTTAGRYLAGATPEAFDPARWADYAVAMAEAGSSGQYFADFPAAAAGDYRVDVYPRAGASPAAADGPPVASAAIAWSGTAPVSLADVAAALVALPRPLAGTVAASPAPTATAFTVAFAPALDAAAVAADIVGLYAKFGTGPHQGAERKVTAVTVASPTSARLTVAPPLASLAVAGDAVSIF